MQLKVSGTGRRVVAAAGVLAVATAGAVIARADDQSARSAQSAGGLAVSPAQIERSAAAGPWKGARAPPRSSSPPRSPAARSALARGERRCRRESASASRKFRPSGEAANGQSPTTKRTSARVRAVPGLAAMSPPSCSTECRATRRRPRDDRRSRGFARPADRRRRLPRRPSAALRSRQSRRRQATRPRGPPLHRNRGTASTSSADPSGLVPNCHQGALPPLSSAVIFQIGEALMLNGRYFKGAAFGAGLPLDHPSIFFASSKSLSVMPFAAWFVRRTSTQA